MIFTKNTAYVEYSKIESFREIWDPECQNMLELCRIKNVSELFKSVIVFLQRDDDESAEVALRNLLYRLNGTNIFTLDFEDIAKFFRILREKNIYE